MISFHFFLLILDYMLNTIFLCKSQAFVLADQVGNICGDILAGSFSIRHRFMLYGGKMAKGLI